MNKKQKKSMFVIIKNKEFFEHIWNKIISDEIVTYQELNLEYLEEFNSELTIEEDINLFFLHNKEGIIGKVILSQTKNPSEFDISVKLQDSGLILKNIDYHINGDSPVHEETEIFEEITYNFYQNILKTALGASHDLHFKKIITISAHIDDHNDLTYWGNFDFSTVWETNDGILGILNSHDQLENISSLNLNIKFISNVILH